MEPTKRRAAMVRGINKLAPRISNLKAKLATLQSAELWLIKEKWSAERELITPQIIPLGMTAKKKEQEEQSLTKHISTMSANEAAELLAMLEARLGKGE